MTDDYLWDRTGGPDPLIEDLERRLAPLKYRAPAARRTSPMRVLLVAAAALLVAAPFAWLRAPQRASLPFEVALLEGAARVKTGRQLSDLRADEARAVEPGATLSVDAGARARVSMGLVGEAVVEGPAELALERSSDELRKLFLKQGALRAVISPSARPRLFQVGTPAGTAVDLGCVYTMRVRDDGCTELRVTLGRVAFEIGRRAVFVRSGATCIADPVRGAGTPVDDDAPASFREALTAFDAARDAASKRAELSRALANARAEDAVALWHVLQSAEKELRPDVAERLNALAPPPAGVELKSCIAGDAAALEAWRLQLMGW